MIAVEELFDQVGLAQDRGWPYSFMRFLGTLGLGQVLGRLGRQKTLPVAINDELTGLSLSQLRDIGRVGAHVGDQTDAALAQVNPLVELLCDCHGPAGSVTQAAGGLLLHGAGSEGCRGLAPPFAALDARYCIASVFHVLKQGFDLLFRGKLRVFSIHLGQFGNEGFLQPFRAKLGRNRPVFYWYKSIDFALAFDYQLERHRLDTPRG